MAILDGKEYSKIMKELEEKERNKCIENAMNFVNKKSTKKFDLNDFIEDMLMNLGIYPSLKGFKFISEAIVISINNPGNIKISDIYKEIGELYNASGTSVERCIRHAIQIFENTESSYKYIVFEHLMYTDRPQHMSNKRFIAECVLYVEKQTV